MTENTAIETFSYIVPNELRDSPTFGAGQFGKRAAEKGKEGIIKCTVGDLAVKPSQEMFSEWQQELKAAHEADPENPLYQTLSHEQMLNYIPAKGTPGMRAAAAHVFAKDSGMQHITADDVAVGNGGKGALNGAVRYLKPGDKVIMASTGWPTNYDMFPAGVEIIEVNSHGRGLLNPDELRAALAEHPDAKAFLFNSPCNPTGEKYDKQEREDIMQVVKEHVGGLPEVMPGNAPNFQVVVDDPYGRIVFDGSDLKRGPIETQMMEQGALTVVRSMSKEYGMAGTRIGFAISKNPFIINHIGKFNETCGGLSGVTQNQAQAALLFGETFIQNTIEDLREKNEAIYNGLKDVPYLEVKKSPATIYSWVDGQGLMGKAVSAEQDLDGKGYVISDTDSMMKFLVETAGVNPVPGAPFYAPNSPFGEEDRRFRVCFSGALEDVKAIGQRIKNAVGELKDPNRFRGDDQAHIR